MRINSYMLLVSLAITGCATAPMVVPQNDWECVNLKARTQIDHDGTTAVARAQHELAVAQAAVAVAKREHVIAAPPSKPAVAHDAMWTDAVADYEHRKADAMTRVVAANTTWARASLAWREHQVTAATAHLPVVEAEYQLARASYIDRHLPASDTYDTAPYRGQLASVQDRWYAATVSEAAARVAFTDATAKLVSAKEEYAQLAMRPPATMMASVPAHLELASFGHFQRPKHAYLSLAH
jgi:hypothetical protein